MCNLYATKKHCPTAERDQISFFIPLEEEEEAFARTASSTAICTGYLAHKTHPPTRTLQ